MTPPTIYPPARVRLVRNTSGWMVEPTRGLIPHVQVGRGSLFGWFDNPSSKVSAHLWLSYGGEFEQYVPFNRRAWAQAAGNPFWISVECEGFETEDYTAIQVQRLAELYAWGMAEFGWRAEITDSPAGFGIGTHRMGGVPWGGPRPCPGDIRANRRGDILRQALAIGAVQQLREDVMTPEQEQRLLDAIGSLPEAIVDLDTALMRNAKTPDPDRPDQPLSMATVRVGSEPEVTGLLLLRSSLMLRQLEALTRGVSAAAPAAAHAMATPGPALQLDDLLDALTRLDAPSALHLAEAAAAHARSLIPTT